MGCAGAGGLVAGGWCPEWRKGPCPGRGPERERVAGDGEGEGSCGRCPEWPASRGLLPGEWPLRESPGVTRHAPRGPRESRTCLADCLLPAHRPAAPRHRILERRL
jgi:hypothetical protein